MRRVLYWTLICFSLIGLKWVKRDVDCKQRGNADELLLFTSVM